jgi:hypothetical protein
MLIEMRGGICYMPLRQFQIEIVLARKHQSPMPILHSMRKASYSSTRKFSSLAK